MVPSHPIETKTVTMNSNKTNTISTSIMSSTCNTLHPVKCGWMLWAHLPQDNNWGLDSYKRVSRFESIEETVAITETLPEPLVKNCMLFVMRDGIAPMWEDPRNRDGGNFSYKISNKIVAETWRDLSYMLVGETLSSNNDIANSVTGISISPKKNFCIIKIWFNNCKNQNPALITSEIPGITSQGVLFNKHDKHADFKG
jgi:hypothetical protein